MGKSALIAGATGLVGKALLDQLLADAYYEKVIVLSRRELPQANPRVKLVVVNFDELYEQGAEISAADYYCCLGTTMKKAGSKEAFYKVDYTYQLELARLAQKDPAFEQFHIVSAVGANSNSVIYYNNVKGQLEEALKALGLKSLHIYQPSLLLGSRNEFRFFEELAKFFSKVLSFFMVGSRGRKLFAIEADTVAKAMYFSAKGNKTGTHVYSPRRMEKIAKQR